MLTIFLVMLSLSMVVLTLAIITTKRLTKKMERVVATVKLMANFTLVNGWTCARMRNEFYDESDDELYWGMKTCLVDTSEGQLLFVHGAENHDAEHLAFLREELKKHANAKLVTCCLEAYPKDVKVRALVPNALNDQHVQFVEEDGSINILIEVYHE
jgi:cobalamin biosynthesis Co2+ chelatase CbiK